MCDFYLRRNINKIPAEIIHAQASKFEVQNIIQEIMEDELLKCVTEFVMSMQNVLGCWKTPLSAGNVISDNQIHKMVLH